MTVPGLGWSCSSAGSGSVPPAAPAPAFRGTWLVCCIQLAGALLCLGELGLEPQQSTETHRDGPPGVGKGALGTSWGRFYKPLRSEPAKSVTPKLIRV